jgi:hypothetical protein
MSNTAEIYPDSSVVLSETFENKRYQSRIKKLFNEIDRYHLDCFVTQTIADECKNRIKKLRTFLDDTLSELYFKIKIAKGQNPIDMQQADLDKSDYQLIMKFFSDKTSQLGVRNETEKERLEYLETYIIKEMDSAVLPNKTYPADSLLGKIASELGVFWGNVEQRLYIRTSQLISSDPDRSYILDLQKRIPTISNTNDLRVLGEISKRRQQTQKLTVWVTLDYRELISNSSAIMKETGVICCDPLYVRLYLGR